MRSQDENGTYKKYRGPNLVFSPKLSLKDFHP
jgi:hypothetical protein